MGALDGRVAVITGAGRGIGRQHALRFSAEGAAVLVNDTGSGPEGTGTDAPSAAQLVVDEIVAAGGRAAASTVDVADWTGGRELIEHAVEAFGRLDVLVNNAGVLRDRALVNMDEADWDVVINVDLKGHFVPTRFAAEYWRGRAKAGEDVRASIIHTSSTSGLLGNPGQTNYGSAKAGVAAFSLICAQELQRYGVRSNCLIPAARTRLTEGVAGLREIVAAPPSASSEFDVWDPANVAPVAAWLATEDCTFNGATFLVQGGTVRLMDPWQIGVGVDRDGAWTVEELRAQAEKFLPR
jgi:NAD(P)-dependent dehydrogenase (short-subunit alcohol dehydrogenase family)